MDERFHIKFRDVAAGEDLGLLLNETGAGIAFSKNLVNPYSAKMGSGDTRDSDLTEWSLISWRDWRTGRGQEEHKDPAAFYDSWNVETRIENQVTLGPLSQNPVGAGPIYEPGNVTWSYFAGWPGPEVQTNPDGGGAYTYVGGPAEGTRKIGQAFVVKNMQCRISSIEVYIKKLALTLRTSN